MYGRGVIAPYKLSLLRILSVPRGLAPKAEHSTSPSPPERQHLSPNWACLVVVVQATWMAYDMVVMRTNPTLAESMRRLEDAFLNCKEEMEKNWQELLTETKRKQ